MTSTTCWDCGTPEEGDDGAGDGLVDGSGEGFAAVGAGEVAGAGWLVACGGSLRGIAPQPEITSVIRHNREGNALEGKNSNFIEPPQRACDPRTEREASIQSCKAASANYLREVGRSALAGC